MANRSPRDASFSIATAIDSAAIQARFMTGGAMLTPTDPVLASEVRSDPGSDPDRLGFSLAAEGGLNEWRGVPLPDSTGGAELNRTETVQYPGRQR